MGEQGFHLSQRHGIEMPGVTRFNQLRGPHANQSRGRPGRDGDERAQCLPRLPQLRVLGGRLQLADRTVAGAVVNGQYWYRDPQSSNGAGLSNAAEWRLCP